MNLQNVPNPNHDFSLEEIDGELLLYHPAHAKAVYLNETAALVWQLCDNERSVEEIVDLLRENYPEASDIQNDVVATLKHLQRNGVVQVGA